MVGITIDRGMLDLVDITGDVWVVLTIVCLVLVDLSLNVFRGWVVRDLYEANSGEVGIKQWLSGTSSF